MDCSSTGSSSESSAAATERRKIDPQLDDRWRIPFAPEETVGVVAVAAAAVLVVVAAAVAKSNRFVFVVSLYYFSVVSRRASKPCLLTFAWTLPRAN